MGMIEGDLPMDLRRLIPRHAKVEVAVKLMSAAVPGGEGLIDPTSEGLAVVAYEVAKYEPVPVRERKQGETKIAKWKIVQHLRPVTVATANSARGREMLGLPPLPPAEAVAKA